MAQVTIIGNLGKDLETKISNGRTYHRLSVCENRKEGEIEKTDWYSVFVESIPEGLKKYLVKGSRILVTGTLKVGLYQGQNGPAIDMTVSANHLQLLNSKADEAQGEKQPAEAEQPF